MIAMRTHLPPLHALHRQAGEEHHTWDLNKGLIGLSAILLGWMLLALMTLQGLSHLTPLPWSVG
jgi:hypothetical protein